MSSLHAGNSCVFPSCRTARNSTPARSPIQLSAETFLRLCAYLCFPISPQPPLSPIELPEATKEFGETLASDTHLLANIDASTRGESTRFRHERVAIWRTGGARKLRKSVANISICFSCCDAGHY